jgi:hypothetical protein
VFEAIYRHWWESTFLPHNIGAVLREAVILGPLAAAIAWIRRG